MDQAVGKVGKRRAVIGFKGLALAPVIENSLTGYETWVGQLLPFAGSMSRTAKESSTDLYYDDELYAQVRNIVGEDVEVRVAEVELARMAELGLGTFDEDTQTLEADFAVASKEYALRFVADTVSSLPFYFNYRVFEMTGIKFDNFATRSDSITVCEVIITGVFKRPQMASLAPYVIMQMAEDQSNKNACMAFLFQAEVKPEGGTGAGTTGWQFDPASGRATLKKGFTFRVDLEALALEPAFIVLNSAQGALTVI